MLTGVCTSLTWCQRTTRDPSLNSCCRNWYFNFDAIKRVVRCTALEVFRQLEMGKTGTFRILQETQQAVLQPSCEPNHENSLSRLLSCTHVYSVGTSGQLPEMQHARDLARGRIVWKLLLTCFVVCVRITVTLTSSVFLRLGTCVKATCW